MNPYLGKSVRIFAFILIILLNSTIGIEDFGAQNSGVIDSLKRALKIAKHDTTRCKILNAMIDAENDDSVWPNYNQELKNITEKNIDNIRSTDPQSVFFKKYLAASINNLGFLAQNKGDFPQAIDFFEKSMKIREEINDKDGIAQSLNNIGTIYKNKGQMELALKHYNKSSLFYEKSNNLEGMANSITNVGAVYESQSDFDNALKCYKKGLSLYTKIGNKQGIAIIKNNIAYVNQNKGDVSGALNDYFESMKVFQEIGDRPRVANSLNSIAFVYQNQGDIQSSLNYHTRCLKLREQIGDKNGLAQSYNNIGLLYESQGDVVKALEFFTKSLSIKQQMGDKNGMALALHNIGLIYDHKEDISQALEYYKKSCRLREETGDKQGIAYCYNNIGKMYRLKKEEKVALDYYSRALKLFNEIGDRKGQAVAMINLSAIFQMQNNLKMASLYGQKGIEISNSLGYPQLIQNGSKRLFSIYKEIGDYKRALENYELYIKMRDSLNNIETQKATIKQQTKYEYDKQKAVEDEKHAAEIKQQEEKAAADKKRQNIVIASVSIVLLLVAVFSVILFNRFRVTQKQKAIIEVKEKETQFQKHLIEEKHKEITDSINYAERIQRSFLATQEHLNKNLSEYFILFKPKDVVSGDFYWSATLSSPQGGGEGGGLFALCTADSTGHGVPGAIMSLLNITSLEKAIETETSPDKILNTTRKIIIERLKKDGSSEGGKDGMDCSLCAFDFKNKKLFVANANNPVWIVRNCHPERSEGSQDRDAPLSLSMKEKEVIEVKGDKMPVGKHDKQDTPFTLKEYDLQKGDIVYTLTDGFPDQFGGEKGKKFMSKNLREQLVANSRLPMQEQRSLLEKTFKDWVGNLEQVDDVTIIGVRI